jgi:hypothetical protein
MRGDGLSSMSIFMAWEEDGLFNDADLIEMLSTLKKSI